MTPTRTSKSSLISIVEVPAEDSYGRIGITLHPDKIDVDAIQRWGATAVVSLITNEEEAYLTGSNFQQQVRDRHMEWWHAPIPDGQLRADFENTWKDVGEAVRDRLRLGFDVFVHGKSGVDHAGTIAARLLVELGVHPEVAIHRVRAAYPSAIETKSQELHIMHCATRAAAVPSRIADDIRDRALGAFLGLAVGDAVGTTLEFHRRDAREYLQDMVGGGPFNLQAGEWTDDTAMALALADSLVAAESLDCRDLMDRFVKWWRSGDYSCTGHCFDIGNTIRGALIRYRKTGNAIAGSTDPWSAGNGSLMRLAPVALRFQHNRSQLVATAAEQSRTTHGAEEAVDACRAFAELLADAIAGTPRPDLLAPRLFEGAEAIAQIMAGSWRRRPRKTICSSGYVVHTLEAAIWAVARTGNFRNAVLLAANLADDADTVAAVSGQLAGAIYGLSGIPDAWLARLAWRDRLLEAGRRLITEPSPVGQTPSTRHTLSATLAPTE